MREFENLKMRKFENLKMRKFENLKIEVALKSIFLSHYEEYSKNNMTKRNNIRW